MHLLRLILALGLLVLTGCGTVQSRKAEKMASYAQLSPSEKRLVDRGQIAAGMDTNAVFMAWGAPSAVIDRSNAGATETIWRYEANRAVLVPSWTYIPTPYGYWSLESTPTHYSKRYTQAEVVFRNGRVVEFNRF